MEPTTPPPPPPALQTSSHVFLYLNSSAPGRETPSCVHFVRSKRTNTNHKVFVSGRRGNTSRVCFLFKDRGGSRGAGGDITDHLTETESDLLSEIQPMAGKKKRKVIEMCEIWMRWL